MAKGQQSGFWLEQPTQGNSRRPPLGWVYETMRGTAQEPVRMAAPANVAVGPSLLVRRTESTPVTVETDAIETEMGETDGPRADAPAVFTDIAPLDNGEQPRKSGMLTLNVLQRDMSKARAAVCWLASLLLSASFPYLAGLRNCTASASNRTEC